VFSIGVEAGVEIGIVVTTGVGIGKQPARFTEIAKRNPINRNRLNLD